MLAGGVMGAQWGALLEAELAGVGVVRSFALSHAWSGDDRDRVRGREAPSVVFASRTEALAAAEAVWSPDRVMYVREVPALRIDTTAGRVLIADLWGDSAFRPIATRAGAGVLRLDSPLCTLLDAVEAMRVIAGPRASIVTLPIGWQPTLTVGRHDALEACVTTMPSGEEATSALTWTREPTDGVGDGPWAALRAFGQVNAREEILRSARLMAAVERRMVVPATTRGRDVDEIEAYLRAMAAGLE